MIGQSIYNRGWQLRLLAHLLRSPDFRSHLCQETVRQEDLDLPSHRAILEAAYEFKRQNEAAVRRNPNEAIEGDFLIPVIVGMVRSGQVYESEVPAIDEAMDMIYSMPLTARLLLSRLGDFLSSQRVRREVNMRASVGEISDTQGFVDQITHLARRSAAEGGSSGGSILASDVGVSCLSDEEIEMSTSGLHCIDVLLGGGIRRGKYGIICAYTGCGKSAWGLQIVRREAERGRHARFHTLEMTWNECHTRFLSAFLQMDYSLLWKGDVNGDENRPRRDRADINAEARRLWNARMADPASRVTIDHFGIWEDLTGCTVQSIRNRIEEERARGIYVSTIVVDYIDKLTLPDGKIYKSDNETTRERLGTISVQLEELASEYDCTIWALTQANDEAQRTSYPRLTASRDSRKKNDPASVYIGIGGTEAMIERGELNVGCPKNRDGRKFHTRVRADFARQTFNEWDGDQGIADQFRVARNNPGNRYPGRSRSNGQTND